MEKNRVKLAVAQVAPAFLDLEASLIIAERWIREAGAQGVEVLTFPETWLPGYPFWIDISEEAARWDHPPLKAVFRRLFENSPEVPGPAIERLCTAAQDAGLTLVMGLSERFGSSLYNSMVYISPQGELLGNHRKLVPTFNERLIWAHGDGESLITVDTPAGRLGGLVCWEHWMPLARHAMHEKHEVLHAAIWPTVNDLHLLAARHYAFEGRCFVMAAGSVLRREHLPKDLELLDRLPGDHFMRGGSAIIGPDSNLLAGPAPDEEQLLIAEADLNKIPEELMTLDVTGHYARPDVFDFKIKP
jgi:predicted amidohydrolase